MILVGVLLVMCFLFLFDDLVIFVEDVFGELYE